MENYCFRFGAVDDTADVLNSAHLSDADAMRDALRTAAEMLKEQASGSGTLAGFALQVLGPGDRMVGSIEIIIAQPSTPL